MLSQISWLLCRNSGACCTVRTFLTVQSVVRSFHCFAVSTYRWFNLLMVICGSLIQCSVMKAFHQSDTFKACQMMWCTSPWLKPESLLAWLSVYVGRVGLCSVKFSLISAFSIQLTFPLMDTDTVCARLAGKHVIRLNKGVLYRKTDHWRWEFPHDSALWRWNTGKPKNDLPLERTRGSTTLIKIWIICLIEQTNE